MKEQEISAIIVDDEPRAREILEQILEDFPEIELKGSHDSVDNALNCLLKYKPDIIFLDVQMPDKDGFELIHELRTYDFDPTIIFTTGFIRYTIQAFKHAAFDYLMKPIDPDELRKTIERYKSEKRKIAHTNNSNHPINSVQKEKLQFNTVSGVSFINIADIIYLEAHGNYTDIHLIDQSVKTFTTNLGRVHQKLPQEQFIKISRSIVINKQFLEEIDRKKKQCLLNVEGQKFSFEMAVKYLREICG